MTTISDFSILPNGFDNLVSAIDVVNATLTDNLNQLSKVSCGNSIYI